MLNHRGDDPEAIKIAEEHGLLFDGMMAGEYEFTTSDKYPPHTRGITFLVKDLTRVEARLNERLTEFGQAPISEEEKWERLLHSIRKAAHILGREVAEPDYLNWAVGRDMNDNLWAQVYAQNKTGKRLQYELKKRGW